MKSKKKKIFKFWKNCQTFEKNSQISEKIAKFKKKRKKWSNLNKNVKFEENFNLEIHKKNRSGVKLNNFIQIFWWL